VIRQYWAVFQGEANANGSIQVKLSTNLGTGISYTGNGAGGAKILGVEIMPGIISPTGIFIPTGAAPITQRDYSSSATWTDSRGNVAPVYPLTDLVCWGDSLTAAAYPSKLSAKYTPARTTLNGGIGGETSSQILARVKGHDYNGGTGITWTPGTIRLKTARALPPRLIDETYRASWTTYAAAIAEPSYVEWFNDGALIGSSSNQLKAVCTVSTTRFSATGHPFANGDVVYFLGTIVTGMYAGKPYYVRDADATGFSVSEYSGTAAISFGSGTVTALGAFYFDWTYAGGTHNITTLTHTNFDTSTLVLWCGANNVDSIAQVQTDITAAFNHAKTQTKGVLILTVIPSNAWSAGSLANMQTINAWILATYPNNSADVYSYLLTKGNGGTQDNTDISAGLTPSSIRVDAIHLTDAGYGYVADFVAAALATKQWSDPTITLAQSGGTYDGSWSYNGGIEGGDFMEVKW
jgi:lysophospholipase L1-like esterase